MAHKLDKAPFLPRDPDSLMLELNRLFINISQVVNDMHMDGFLQWAPGPVAGAPVESPVFSVPDIRDGDFMIVATPYALPVNFLAQAQVVAADQAKIIVYNWLGTPTITLGDGLWSVRGMRRHVE